MSVETSLYEVHYQYNRKRPCLICKNSIFLKLDAVSDYTHQMFAVGIDKIITSPHLNLQRINQRLWFKWESTSILVEREDEILTQPKSCEVYDLPWTKHFANIHFKFSLQANYNIKLSWWKRSTDELLHAFEWTVACI